MDAVLLHAEDDSSADFPLDSGIYSQNVMIEVLLTGDFEKEGFFKVENGFRG